VYSRDTGRGNSREGGRGAWVLESTRGMFPHCIAVAACRRSSRPCRASSHARAHLWSQEVDNCNYFLFWFGGCYGWAPPAEQFNVETKNRAWLADLRGESSYAVRSPNIETVSAPLII
jgi:hypothetical protein